MKKLLRVLVTFFLMSILAMAIAAPALAASPNADVGIEALPEVVPAGGTTILLVTERNTGDVALSDVWVYLTENFVHINTFYKGSQGWLGGDADRDGKLDRNETWTWAIRVRVPVDTLYEVYGDVEYNGVGIYAPIYPSQKDHVDVKVVNSSWWSLLLNWLSNWRR